MPADALVGVTEKRNIVSQFAFGGADQRDPPGVALHLLYDTDWARVGALRNTMDSDQ